MQKGIPIYIQISELIREKIINGSYSHTNMLPTEAKIAQEFSASRATVRKAIDLLINEDLVVRKQGSGTYIREKKIHHNVFALQSFKEEMNHLNIKYENKVLEFKVIKADNRISTYLDLEEGEEVYFSKRLKFIGDSPAIIEDSYMPLKLFKDLSYNDLVNSKYDYIEKKKGFSITGSRQEIIPIIPNQREMELLNIEVNSPALKINLVSFMEAGTIFEYTELIFNSSSYKFTLNSIRGNM